MTVTGPAAGAGPVPLAPLDVLIVLASAQRRGAEIEGLGLARWLAARGHRAQAVALAAGGGDPLDVDVLGDAARSLATARAVRARLGGRARVVVAYGSDTLPMVALATLGTRTRWVYRSVGDPRAWARGRLHRLRTASLLWRADRVVTLWDGAAEAMHELYRLPRRRLAVIGNERPAQDFPPVTPEERAAARARFAVDGPVVAFLGALSDEKRPVDAMRAVAALPGVTLLVAGRGPEQATLETLAEQLAPGRVRLLGEVRDAGAVLAAADVVVLPSRTEGMPGVVLEARLRGVPVVATAVGAVPEMLRDGGGVTVPPGDLVALTDALARVLAEPTAFAGARPPGAGVSGAQWERLLAQVSKP